jgi:hypothetical protein
MKTCTTFSERVKKSLEFETFPQTYLMPKGRVRFRIGNSTEALSTRSLLHALKERRMKPASAQRSSEESDLRDLSMTSLSSNLKPQGAGDRNAQLGRVSVEEETNGDTKFKLFMVQEK